jgi:hypothetical protein
MPPAPDEKKSPAEPKRRMPPTPQLTSTPTEKESSVVATPEPPSDPIDFRRVPGCFDIVRRGSFPRISFSADVVL